MSSDTRQWTCPDCGKKVELSIFKLDPLACEECLAKRKGKNGESAAADPAKSLPDLSKFGGAAVGLALGLIVGFVAGRWTAPEATGGTGSAPPSASRSGAERNDGRADTDDAPDESTRPGPNYKWVKGYTRKDGVHVKGHWAKDSRKSSE